jgi:hypothetical protein
VGASKLNVTDSSVMILVVVWNMCSFKVIRITGIIHRVISIGRPTNLLAGLKVTGLPKHFHSLRPGPFIAVSVDATGEQRTEPTIIDGDARWEEDLAL